MGGVHYSLYGLAEVWKEQAKFGFAERMLKCLLEMLAESSSKRVETVIELADVFRLQNRFHDAENMLQQAAATVENKRNSQALSLKLEKCAACILRDKGETTAAETQFSHLLALQKALLGADHPEALNSEEQIAILIQSQGRSEEALRILENCCASSENVLGPQHGLTKQRNVLLNRWKEGKDAEDMTPLAITPPKLIVLKGRKNSWVDWKPQSGRGSSNLEACDDCHGEDNEVCGRLGQRGRIRVLRYSYLVFCQSRLNHGSRRSVVLII